MSRFFISWVWRSFLCNARVWFFFSSGNIVFRDVNFFFFLSVPFLVLWCCADCSWEVALNVLVSFLLFFFFWYWLASCGGSIGNMWFSDVCSWTVSWKVELMPWFGWFSPYMGFRWARAIVNCFIFLPSLFFFVDSFVAVTRIAISVDGLANWMQPRKPLLVFVYHWTQWRGIFRQGPIAGHFLSPYRFVNMLEMLWSGHDCAVGYAGEWRQLSTRKYISPNKWDNCIREHMSLR